MVNGRAGQSEEHMNEVITVIAVQLAESTAYSLHWAKHLSDIQSN